MIRLLPLATLAALIAVAVTLVLLALIGEAKSHRSQRAPIIHATDHARLATWRYQTMLGEQRRRTTLSYRRSHSEPYRRWALQLWRGRRDKARERFREWRASLAVWYRLAECESHGNWSIDAYHDGGLQFLPSTWTVAARLVPGASRYTFAWQAPPLVQIRVAQAWLAVTSWSQWPFCSAALGLR